MGNFINKIKESLRGDFAETSDLADVATSGDYNDLINKPNVGGEGSGGADLSSITFQPKITVIDDYAGTTYTPDDYIFLTIDYYLSQRETVYITAGTNPPQEMQEDFSEIMNSTTTGDQLNQLFINLGVLPIESITLMISEDDNIFLSPVTNKITYYGQESITIHATSEGHSGGDSGGDSGEK